MTNSDQLDQRFLGFTDVPKVHKDGVPLRPILDMTNSPYHAIAKWLNSILDPIRKSLSIYSVKDTFEFIECIKNINVKGKSMLSLDVTSLFTNVPLNETILFLCNHIDNNHIDLGIPTQYIRELLLRCTFNVQFRFNNLMYRQTDGVAMGSPLGPLLADCFMAKLETYILKPTIDQFTIYKRYMDDIFIITEEKSDHSYLLKIFNDSNSSVKFTVEEETNAALPFLDVLVSKRSDGTLQRTVYRKPTWNGQLTNFHSWCPLKYKRNLIRTLCSRARRICTPDTFDLEMNKLRSTFEANGYPRKFIEVNMKHQSSRYEEQTVPKKQLYINLDYKCDVSCEILRNRLNRSIKRTFPAASLCISFTPRRLFQLCTKDKLSHLTTSMCIYQFTCSCGAKYIGRTSRQLSERVTEHYPPWFIKGERKAIRSSILEHLVDSEHKISPDSAFRVIYRTNANVPKAVRIRHLAIAEAIAIRLWKPELCIQKKLMHDVSLPWSL